jgi:hypothetical protein
MVMNARDAEAALLERCVLVASPARSANAAQDTAQNAREANVFRLAALVLRPHFPYAAAQWQKASEAYFAAHPQEQVELPEVLRKGWVVSLPRLRDVLSQRLKICKQV